MSCKRAARVATALIGVSIVALTAANRAEAAWWSRSAPEDTDLTLVSGGRTVPDPQPVSYLDSLQSYVVQAAGAGASVVSSAGSALAQVPGLLAAPVGAVSDMAKSTAETMGQFAWEVAYVFGTNGTPVTAIPVTDPYDPPYPDHRGDNPRTAFRSGPKGAEPASGPQPAAPATAPAATPAQSVPSQTATAPVAVAAAAPAAPTEPAESAQADPDPVPLQGGSSTSQAPVQVAALPPAAPPAPVKPAATPASVPPPAASTKAGTDKLAGAGGSAADAAGDPIDPQLFANFVFDKAQRRPDGSFFVPKPLQRLFDVRTQKVETGETPLSVKLPGRIVPDPNAHGDVEASLVGRIEAPKSGMPVLGQEVKQGQILGYVTPAVGVVDRTQVRREVARLTNEIRVTAESVELLKQFWFVPFRDGKIIQAEMKLEGLRRERAALLPMLQTQEVLRASTDGVISVTNAINGRIVHPGEKIFEIVNPKRLWVEAVAADPDVAKTAAAVDSAVALTPEGHSLDINFVGSGLALQQQAVPLMFRIDQPIEGLRVGRPVTVAVRSTEKARQGIAVPKEAVVAGSNGLEQVWEHVGPEIFVPRTVKTEAIDGRTVLVIAGLSPGAQIVTRGTRLMVQLQ